MRLILANLLCEEELVPRPRTPSRETLRMVSGLATLLRAFAREGDRLWTPAPVEPGRVAPVPGLPVPVLESGPVEPAEEVLAWCARRSCPCGGLHLDQPLHELMWNLPTAAPEVFATVHHRSFHLKVAQELGCALPGARMVKLMDELDRVLASPEAPAAWVVKAPLSASGRSRYIERNGPSLFGTKARRTVERLFEHHGPLLFEPWMDRTADFGYAALLTPGEVKVLGSHRQTVDSKGQFAGIELPATVPDPELMEEVVHGVAEALRRAGYVGPFGIDAWQYRVPDGTPDGRLAFHPLGEINARMTFGLVARALVERLGIEGPARLALGAQAPPEALLLLRPDHEGSGAAWLEA